MLILLRFMEEGKVNPVSSPHVAHGLTFASGNDSDRGFIVLHEHDLQWAPKESLPELQPWESRCPHRMVSSHNFGFRGRVRDA